MRKKSYAVVIDNSGSMTNMDLFTLNNILQGHIIEAYSYCDIDLLLDLAKRYVKVYFVTDGGLDARAQLMIKMAGNIEVLTI